MSFTEHTARLERSFRTTTDLLRRMLQGLQARRTAWVSARPSVIAPSAELEQIAQALAAEEQVRSELLAELAKALPSPLGVRPQDHHLNVTRIAAAMPVAAARSLREAADAARALAKTVRVEVTLGQRLLRFTQRAQDDLMHRLSGEPDDPKSAAGYDRNARARRGLGVGSRTAGTLIDGRM